MTVNLEGTGIVWIRNEKDSVTKLRPVGISKSVIVDDLAPIIKSPALGSVHYVLDVILVAIVIHDDMHDLVLIHAENIFSNLTLPRCKDIILVQGLSEYCDVVPISNIVGWCLSSICDGWGPLKLYIFRPILIAGCVDAHYHISPQFNLGRLVRGSYGLTGEKRLPSDEKEREEYGQSSIAVGPCEYSSPHWRAFVLLCALAGLTWMGLGDARRLRIVTGIHFLFLITWVCIAGHTDNGDENKSESEDGPVLLHVSAIVPSHNPDISRENPRLAT